MHELTKMQGNSRHRTISTKYSIIQHIPHRGELDELEHEPYNDKTQRHN